MILHHNTPSMQPTTGDTKHNLSFGSKLANSIQCSYDGCNISGQEKTGGPLHLAEEYGIIITNKLPAGTWAERAERPKIHIVLSKTR